MAIAKEFTLFSNQVIDTLAKMPKVLEARQAEKFLANVHNLKHINQENTLSGSRSPASR